MEARDFLQILKRKKGTIVSIVAIFLAFTAAFIFVQPLKYEADSKLLIVQDLNGAADPYTVAKSNEYLSSILSSVTTSDYFFRDVMSAGFNIDQNYFPERADKKMKLWAKTINAKAIGDTGIITVAIYHPDKYQLEQIARAVNFVLKTKNNQYHGQGDKVNVKIIDEPIISNWPTKPNIPLDATLALILGMIFSLAYIYSFPEERYDIRFWPSFKKKEKMEYTVPDVEGDNWKSVAEVLRKAQDNHLRQTDEKKEEHREEKENSEYEKKDEHITHEHHEVKGHGSMKNIFN